MQSRGILLETLDRFYDSAESFDDMYDKIFDYICACREEHEVVLCVSGSPAVGDLLVKRIIQSCNDEIKLIPCAGVAEHTASVANTVMSEGVNIIPAHLFRKDLVNTRVNTLITEADNKFLTSEIKLKLLEMYPYYTEILYQNLYHRDRTLLIHSSNSYSQICYRI